MAERRALESDNLERAIAERMLRQTLLFLSRQPTLRRWMETSKSASVFTRRFIAGRNLEEALKVATGLQPRGFRVSLDHLGENVATEADASEARETYESALQALSSLGLGATISVKLTQLGLDLGESDCLANGRRLAEMAKLTGSRVEIDMEGSAYTEATLRIAERLHAETGSVRAVIQAYLYRSEEDIRRLNGMGVPVRLCKGAYDEPATVAMPAKADVDANYLKLAQLLLGDGTDPAFATHDPAMIQGTLEFARLKARGSEEFEFQMLYGVRRDLQEQLRADGWRMRLYVPYGDAWYPYFMRRLAERPANVFFIAKNLLRA